MYSGSSQMCCVWAYRCHEVDDSQFEWAANFNAGPKVRGKCPIIATITGACQFDLIEFALLLAEANAVCDNTMCGCL